MGNLQYRSTVWICQHICADSAFFQDVCPTIPLFKTMMRQNASWGRYAVYITWLHRHFPSQGYIVFRYLKRHHTAWTYSFPYLVWQLEQLLSYTLHKPRRRRFPTLPTKVFSINEQFVMDLVDLQKLAKYNKGYKYLLTLIDVLSIYAWVEPLKSKSATALVEALERLGTRLGPHEPQKVQTDSDP